MLRGFQKQPEDHAPVAVQVHDRQRPRGNRDVQTGSAPSAEVPREALSQQLPIQV